MKRRNVAIAVSAGAAALAAGLLIGLLVWRAVRETPADRSRKTASALVAGMHAAVERAATLRDPFRCARLEDSDPDESPRVIEHGGHRYEQLGQVLRIDKDGGDELVIGVVADARGGSEPTLQRLAALRQEMVSAGVELVISLGGQARSRTELIRVLSALALDASWIVVALPGDREALPDHRAAIAEVDGAQAVIVDGSQVRFLEHGKTVIATFPGVAYGSQLVAADDGCVHTAEDATALASVLARGDGLRIVASYAAPRQRGPGASDLTQDGIHVGEQLLADALVPASPTLVLHGLVEDAARLPGEGQHPAGGEDMVVATGSLEAAPNPLRHRSVTSSAIIARVKPDRVRWRRVVVESGP